LPREFKEKLFVAADDYGKPVGTDPESILLVDIFYVFKR
jgi:hypothetical protein